MGEGPESAADDHAEAALAVADDRAQADVVDGAHDAIFVGAAIEGDLEFARQVAGEVLAEEGVGEALGVGADVEDFVLREPGPGAGGDVADRVVAGFAIGEADVGEEVHEVGDLGEGDEVILDVLAGGEVAAAAAEFVGDARELIHLLRRSAGRRESCSGPSGRPAGAGRRCRASGGRGGTQRR